MTRRPFDRSRQLAAQRGRVKTAQRSEIALDDELTEIDPNDYHAFNRATWKITPVLDPLDKTVLAWRVYHRGRWLEMAGNRPSREDALRWLHAHNYIVGEL